MRNMAAFPPEIVPLATIFMFIVAVAVSTLTSLANRLLSNPERSKAWRKEISDWNSELREARKSGDKKELEKVMKKQKQIFQLQSKMTWQQMKVTLLFIVPLFIMWQLLGGIYGLRPIAYFPGLGPDIYLPIIGRISSLFWWYLLCSMLFGTVFSHLLGMVEVSD